MSSSAKELRESMIEQEMETILNAARDFCFEHLEEDMEEEALNALQIAARNLAYRKKYYDVMKDTIVYFPTCSKLILSRDLIEEAEKHYYDEQDEFPAEYAKAVRSVVFHHASEAKSSQSKDDSHVNTDEQNEKIDDEEFMAKLAMEWTEALE
jgi:hypothetical protein